MTITYDLLPPSQRKPKPESELGFGKIFTDHMFIADYTEGQGWHDPRIVPYAPLSMDPASMVLHYAQENFEGLKAYRAADGRVLMFRPDENARRMNTSSARLCMPAIDPEMWVEWVTSLVRVDSDWVPGEPGQSLYIRPFIIATDPFVGVRASLTYKFIVILSPVGSYYAGGLAPTRIYVENNYVRAVKGGTGFTKCGGNYAASILSQYEAKKQGYDQVLWLDGVHRRYIEEVGTMNVFFVIGDQVVTPPIEGSILPGITRKSCIQLLRSWGCDVNERPLPIDEVVAADKAGSLREIFGTGTAAVISPVGELRYQDHVMQVNGGQIGEISKKLYDNLTGIQWGSINDPYGWVVQI